MLRGARTGHFFYEKDRTKGSEVRAKGHGEAFPWLGLSPNQRTGSTHQAIFQNNCGLVCLPFSISARETLAVLQNVGCLGRR